MRVLADIPELHSREVRVCRFDKEWWLLYYLWGDEEFRNKAIAIWFQMAELVWKSMYYEDDPSFLEHEALGDELGVETQVKVNGQVIILADTNPLHKIGYCQWKNINTGQIWNIDGSRHQYVLMLS